MEKKQLWMTYCASSEIARSGLHRVEEIQFQEVPLFFIVVEASYGEGGVVFEGQAGGGVLELKGGKGQVAMRQTAGGEEEVPGGLCVWIMCCMIA